MKTYAREKRVKLVGAKNELIATTFKQYVEQVEWKEKGWIEKITYEYAKYIEMKKELKAKGLI